MLDGLHYVDVDAGIGAGVGDTNLISNKIIIYDHCAVHNRAITLFQSIHPILSMSNKEEEASVRGCFCLVSCSKRYY